MSILLYKKPADGSTLPERDDRFPVGNGRLGALATGGITRDILSISEESMWSGPSAERDNRSFLQCMAEGRALRSEGRCSEAEEIESEGIAGYPLSPASYQEPFSLIVDFFSGSRRQQFEHIGVYKRQLDLETGVASISFSSESEAPSTAIFARNSNGSSVSYTRELIASARQDVIAYHIGASIPGMVNFRACFKGGMHVSKQFAIDDDTIAMTDTHGIPYAALCMVSISGGKTYTRGGCLIVEGADDATLYIDVETAWRNGRYRRTKGRTARSPLSLADWCADRALKKLCFAQARPFTEIKDEHVRDYGILYNKVKLSLDSEVDASVLHMDAVPEEHTALFDDFRWHYARYLTISSVRVPGELPPLSQGIWAEPLAGTEPCKNGVHAMYHAVRDWKLIMESLLSAGFGGASDVLFQHIKRMYKRGKKTSRIMFGTSGWVSHEVTDIWGDTAPSPADFEARETNPLIPTGVASLALLVREWYEYTLDKKQLRTRLPALNDACAFFEEAADIFGTDSFDKRNVVPLLRAAIACAGDLRLADHFMDYTKYKALLKQLGEIPAPSAKSDVSSWNFLAAPLVTSALMTSLIADCELEGERLTVKLLPALPSYWTSGSVSALRIRGNLMLDIAWKDGRLTEGRVYARHGTVFASDIAFVYEGKTYRTTIAGDSLDIRNVLPSTI